MHYAARVCIERCLCVLRDLPVVGSVVVVVGSSDVVVTGKGVVVGDGDSTVVVASSQESSSVGPCEELLSSSFSASKALAALRVIRW